MKTIADWITFYTDSDDPALVRRLRTIIPDDERLLQVLVIIGTTCPRCLDTDITTAVCGCSAAPSSREQRQNVPDTPFDAVSLGPSR